MKSIRDCGRQHGRRRSEVNQTGRLHKVSSFIMEEQDGTEQGEERKRYEEQRGLWFCLVWSVYLKVSPVFVPALKDKVRRFSSHSKASEVPPKKKRRPGFSEGAGCLPRLQTSWNAASLSSFLRHSHYFALYDSTFRHCFTTQWPRETWRKIKCGGFSVFQIYRQFLSLKMIFFLLHLWGWTHDGGNLSVSC